MVSQSIFGVWSLLSFNYFLPNGTSILQPNGPNPIGKFVITPEGWAAVHITTPEAMQPIANGVKWGDATDEEIGPIARPFVAYSGPYTTRTTIDGQLQILTDVKIALDPSWVRLQTRNVSWVTENGKEYMTLKPVGTIPMTLPGGISGSVVSELKWEKEVSACRHKKRAAN